MRGKGQQCGERLGTRRPWKPLGSKLGLRVSQRLTRAPKLVQRVTDGYVLSGGQDGKGLPGRRTCVDKAGREATMCGIRAGTTVEREPGEEGPRERDGTGGVSRGRGRGHAQGCPLEPLV